MLLLPAFIQGGRCITFRKRHNFPNEDRSKRLEIQDSGGTFYYSRGDRERLSPPNEGSWYKKNRGLMILAVDVFIILVFLGVYQIFLKPDNSTVEFAEHRFELRALEFNEEVLVTLRITALEDRPPDSPPILDLQFAAREDFFDSEDVREILPSGKDQTISTRIKLPLPPPPELSGASRVFVRGAILPDTVLPDDIVWDFTVYAEVDPE
ncbi:MAG: hypothetical protein ACR2PY_08440 [Salinispira sp.]